MLQVEKGEWVNAVISVSEYNEDAYLFFTTKHGIAKRTQLSHFANIRKGGIIALSLKENDELISVKLTDGNQEVFIATNRATSFVLRRRKSALWEEVLPVKGISLRDDDEVVSMEIIQENSKILHVTSNGFGKKTKVEEYRRINRGGKGVLTCKINEKTGHVVAVKAVFGNEDLMVMTAHGVLIRMPVADISETGRNAMGVVLIRLQEGQEVATVTKIDHEAEEEKESDMD